jgi:hypothetical protein
VGGRHIEEAEVEITSRTHFLFLSKVLDGLARLVRVRWKVIEGESEIAILLRVPMYGAEYKIAIDVHDKNDRFEESYLARCDLYLKRSYVAAAVPARWSSKVVPFGINYGFRGRGVAAVVCRTGVMRIATDPVGFAVLARQYLLSPRAEDFERPPRAPATDAILFQTRVFPPGLAGLHDAERLNEERVVLLKRLQREFGNRFVGGLYPDAFARSRYPSLVTRFPSAPRDYIRWSRQFRIAIYTGGLFDSIAFKMAEYLASSKCIVSARFRNELPQPLEHGTHLLHFSSADECLSCCEALLRDERLALHLSQEAWRYYRSFVEPAAHMSWLLREVETRIARGLVPLTPHAMPDGGSRL